jgi:hypothetical protein
MGIIERALSEAGIEVTTLTTDHDLELQGSGAAAAGAKGGRRL